MERHRSACGCEEGSVVMLLGLVAYAVVVALRPGGLGAVGWGEVGVGVAVAFAAALTGKIAGILRARWRLRATRRAYAARRAEVASLVGEAR